MSDWKCGRCGKVYEFEEFCKLESVPLVPEDTNPWEQHGFTSVCVCGYIFHRDKWRKQTEVGLKEGLKAKVSTVFLELNHKIPPNGKDLWYETMIFGNKLASYFCERYTTQEEAEKRHDNLVGLLREEKYTLVPTEFSIELKGEGGGERG